MKPVKQAWMVLDDAGEASTNKLGQYRVFDTFREALWWSGWVRLRVQPVEIRAIRTRRKAVKR